LQRLPQEKKETEMSFWNKFKDWVTPYISGPYPTEKYLTIVEGYVIGPVRWECPETLEEKFIIQPGFATIFKNQGPVIDAAGKMWEVSIIQKKSPFGNLITNPDCRYEWNMKHLQQQDTQGNWIQGTEFGEYKRQAFKWRRDLRGTNGKHWVFTWGYIGTHFD